MLILSMLINCNGFMDENQDDDNFIALLDDSIDRSRIASGGVSRETSKRVIPILKDIEVDPLKDDGNAKLIIVKGLIKGEVSEDKFKEYKFETEPSLEKELNQPSIEFFGGSLGKDTFGVYAKMISKLISEITSDLNDKVINLNPFVFRKKSDIEKEEAKQNFIESLKKLNLFDKLTTPFQKFLLMYMFEREIAMIEIYQKMQFIAKNLGLEDILKEELSIDFLKESYDKLRSNIGSYTEISLETLKDRKRNIKFNCIGLELKYGLTIMRKLSTLLRNIPLKPISKSLVEDIYPEIIDFDNTGGVPKRYSIKLKKLFKEINEAFSFNLVLDSLKKEETVVDTIYEWGADGLGVLGSTDNDVTEEEAISIIERAISYLEDELNKKKEKTAKEEEEKQKAIDEIISIRKAQQKEAEEKAEEERRLQECKYNLVLGKAIIKKEINPEEDTLVLGEGKNSLEFKILFNDKNQVAILSINKFYEKRNKKRKVTQYIDKNNENIRLDKGNDGKVSMIIKDINGNQKTIKLKLVKTKQNDYIIKSEYYDKNFDDIDLN